MRRRKDAARGRDGRGDTEASKKRKMSNYDYEEGER